MTLVRFRPNKDFDIPAGARSFSNLMDEFFNDALTTGNRSGFTPGVNISEDNSHYYIDVALPGMKKEEIKINVDDHTLYISGERHQESKKEDVKYHLVETSYGKFERAFSLPENANEDNIKAEFNDGILKLSVEKKQKKVSKEISVK